MQSSSASKALPKHRTASLSPTDPAFAGADDSYTTLAPVLPRVFTDEQRRYLESARLGRLATADAKGRPHAVPVCFALVGDRPVTPIDEKPKRADAADLRRVRNVRENPRVALVVDHWADDWSELGWLQIRATAAVADPDAEIHPRGVDALREKYPQYADHDLERRPMLVLDPGRVLSWGDLREY